MKDKTRHLSEDELIEFYYNESPSPEWVKTHLSKCQFCNNEYNKLKGDMEKISEDTNTDFWDTQRLAIISNIEKRHLTKMPLLVRWWRPVSVSAIIVFIIIGLYISTIHTPLRYTKRDAEEEYFFDHITALIEQPITSSLDYIDLADEEGYSYDYSFEKLDIFGSWPELISIDNYEDSEV